MPTFRGEQLTPLFQRKWEIEEQNREPFGKGLAQGVKAGIQQLVFDKQLRKKSEYELAVDMFRDYLKNYDAVDKETGKPLSIKDKLGLIHLMASGRANELPSTVKWIPKETETDLVVRTLTTPQQVEFYNKYIPGLNAQVGVPFEISRKTERRLLSVASKERLSQDKLKKQEERHKQRLKEIESKYRFVSKKVEGNRPLSDRDKLNYYQKLVALENSYLDKNGKVAGGFESKYLEAQKRRLNWEKRYPHLLGVIGDVRPEKKVDEIDLSDEEIKRLLGL